MSVLDTLKRDLYIPSNWTAKPGRYQIGHNVDLEALRGQEISHVASVLIEMADRDPHIHAAVRTFVLGVLYQAEADAENSK